jgi:hypothetical protein
MMMICLQLLAAAAANIATAATAAGAGGTGAASGDAPPLCTSCASWCAGDCAFAGPPVVDATSGREQPNSRTRQNITIYRMTAENVTDLDSKNTGDPAGDMVFNMDERAIPIVCRHATGSTPDCTEGNTHSWLLNSKLVYLQWEIEVDGRWGPYIPCNLNITAFGGKPGDNKWYCPASKGEWNPQQRPFEDAHLCDCNATEAAVGWKDMNATTQGSSGHSRLPSAQCNSTARSLCSGAMQTNYSSCRQCLDTGSNSHLLRNESCISYELTSALCPKPAPASAVCKAAAEQACGQFRTPALHLNCSRCLSLNRRELQQPGVCGEEG